MAENRSGPVGSAPARLRRLATAAGLRWVGFAGAVLLAVAAYLAGALPGPAPASRTEALWGGPALRAGLLLYVAGLALLGVAWWLLRALAARPGVTLRWNLVTGALWAAPLLVAPPLGSRDLYAYACQGAVWRAGHDPYTVGPAAGECPWLETVPVLWHDAPAPYGPVALLASLAAASPGSLLVALALLRLVALLGAVLLAWYGPRLARSCGVEPAAAAWLGLVTPLVAVHVVSGAHHDALVAGLLVAALALALPCSPILEKSRSVDLHGPGFLQDRRGRAAAVAGMAAGVAVGLAVAVKVTALAALPFVLLLAGRRWWQPAAGAVAAFGGVTLASGLGLGWVGSLTGTGAIGQWSSLPTGLGMGVGYVLWGLGFPAAFDTAVTAAQLAGMVGLAGLSAGLLWWAWRRRHQPRLVVLAAGLVLAAVVVLGPVVYPWYAVTPLAVLAAAVRSPRARHWLAVATLVVTALVLPTGLGLPVLTRFPGAVLVTGAVLAGLGYLLVSWRRHRTRPPRHRAESGP